MDSFYNYFSLVLFFAIPLIMTALGALFSERSGVVNIAMEGLMIVGAFVGILFINGKFTPGINSAAEFTDAIGGVAVYLLGVLMAIIAGILVSYLHAVASIKMKADQIISATAINTLTPALALFLTMSLALGQSAGTDKLPVSRNLYLIKEVPLLSKIPFFGELFFQNVYPGFYIGVIVIIVTYIVIYKTKFGLRLRACGENPHAADAAGVNIYKIRYLGVLISGAIAGASGFIFVIGFTIEFNASVVGYGFLAIAVMIFGNWQPFKIVGAAFLFAGLLTLSDGISFFPALDNLEIPEAIISMLPYLITIVVLVITSKNSRAPKAAGQIFDKGER
ncbi:MAG: ABC transporter permease [Tenericutes bacterium]|jgi:ABC-type uncharacterized transport system permease subunit|nr:ABC transporter permease [Mycoplasmatota bacterium]